MTDGHTSFLGAFAFRCLPYCSSKSGGDPFGDSGGEANLSSRPFQLPARLLLLTAAGRCRILSLASRARLHARLCLLSEFVFCAVSFPLDRLPYHPSFRLTRVPSSSLYSFVVTYSPNSFPFVHRSRSPSSCIKRDSPYALEPLTLYLFYFPFTFSLSLAS
jgi:hypothetical protein